MQSRVLLHVRQLLEAAIAVGTFVRFLAGVHSNVLHQLMVAAETLQTLLALVRLHVRRAANAAAARRTTERRRQSADAAVVERAAAAASRARCAAALKIARVLHLHGALVHKDLYICVRRGGGWIYGMISCGDIGAGKDRMGNCEKKSIYRDTHTSITLALIRNYTGQQKKNYAGQTRRKGIWGRIYLLI